MDTQADFHKNLKTTMNTSHASFSGFLLDAGMMRGLAVMMLAVAIFLSGFAVLLILWNYFDPLRKRLDNLVVEQSSPTPSLDHFGEQLSRFAHLVLPKDQELQNKTQDRLTQAGYRFANRLPLFYFCRVLLIVSLPALIFFTAPFFSRIQPHQILFFALIAGLVGMILPSYVLDRKIRARQRLLRNGLPDAIDLLVVCTEAGLGLNAAVLRVSEVIGDMHPTLAEELALVTSEMRAGVERNQALGNLARRTGLDDIKGLVAVLAQSMRFGTSIAQTLRIYAEEFRDKRMQKAEEEAAKLGSKMIFPLALCLLPGFFIVVIGPAVIKIMEFLPTLSK